MTSGRNKPRVVSDTNIYISALLFGGTPAEIIELAREKKIQLIASPFILLELARILQAKFKFKRKMALEVIAEIKRISEVVYSEEKVEAIKQDPSDNKILECALAGRADHIISGDGHLLELGKFKNIIICSPTKFIRLF